MIEGSDGFCFSLEPRAPLAGGRLRREDLESDLAVELRVVGFVDDPHTAAAELFQDLVLRSRLPYERIRFGRAIGDKQGKQRQLVEGAVHGEGTGVEGGQQRRHLAPEGRVVGTGLFETHRPLGRVEVDEGIVYFGRSLGASVAVELATRYPPRALVLESPFTSIQGMAQKTYPVVSKLVPLGLIVQSRFDAIAKIGQVHTPVMVLHGDQDDMIPIEMGRELFEAANEPKAFYAIRGASHNDTYAVGGAPYFDALRAFVNRTD